MGLHIHAPIPVGGNQLSQLVSAGFNPAFINSIQHGTITFDAANPTKTATIVAVQTNCAAVLFLGCDSNTNTDASSDTVDVVLTNATTVTATRVGTATTGHPIVSFLVIEFVPGALRSLQTFSMSMTGASQTATITAVVQGKAMILPGGTTYDAADVLISKFYQTTVLTNATTVTTARVTAAGTLVVVGTVLEFW